MRAGILCPAFDGGLAMLDDNAMRSKFRGCLLASACGDALGAGIEFMAPEAIRAKYGVVTDFAGGGPFDWPAGAYTDDTQMTLALADSLIEHPEVDLPDITKHWLTWLESNPPDVGGLTRDALVRARTCLLKERDPREAGEAAWEIGGRDAAGNGGLMRTSPIGLLFHYDYGRLKDVAAAVSAITHYDPRCQASCIAFCLALAALVKGRKPKLSALAETVRSLSSRTAGAIINVKDMKPEHVPSSGYTLDTLQAALYPIEQNMKLEDGIILIVNLGYDADTCGAVAGALLGARDGEEAIPRRWLEQLKDVDRIRDTADALWEIAMRERGQEPERKEE